MSDNEMRRVDSSPKIDLSEWTFGFGDLDKNVAEAAREAIENVFKETPPSLSLPIVWGPNGDGMGGPAVADPVTIYLHLPFDLGGDAECTWAISLESLVVYYFECDQQQHPHPSMASAAKMFADRLRDIADKLSPQEPKP